MIVGLAYSKPGVIVVTHVARVSGRLGLTANKDPRRSRRTWKGGAHALVDGIFLLAILHGRYLCKARKPDCPRCSLRET
jgi:endonuclease-3